MTVDKIRSKDYNESNKIELGVSFMKNWKSKYIALFLVAALGGAVMAFSACDGEGGEQSSQSNSVETSSSLTESSLDESASEEVEQSSAETSEETSEEKPEEKEGMVTEEEWEKAFAIKNYSLHIKQIRAGETDVNANYYFDQDENKYAVTYEETKGVELYVETLGSFEEYNRYEKNEKTGEWEKIFVSGEHYYSEMYFALNVFNQAFGKRFKEFTYDAEKGIYYIEKVCVEEITGGGTDFDKVEISFNGKQLKTVTFFWTTESDLYSMVNTLSNWGEISITLPEVKEPVKNVTEEEWEKALTATNYTALGEMWTTNSTSPVLNVKREENSYYMGTTSEEYIVQVGEPNVYFRWDRSEKAWKEDDSAPSQQHLIPEQMRAVLHGAYNLFDYNEEKGCYEASEVALTLMGQTMTFDVVTVSFENGNLSVLYCDAITSGLRFTYSQYGATRVEFFEKTDTEEGPSINDTDNTNNGNGATTDKSEEDFSK